MVRPGGAVVSDEIQAAIWVTLTMIGLALAVLYWLDKGQ